MRHSSWEHQKKRKLDFTKAKRKKDIHRQLYGYDWYNNLHQYSKNKIHCSCGMCRFRNAWDPDRKPIQDMRRIDAMEFQYEEYLHAS